MTDSQASATWPFNRTTIRSGEYQLSVTDVGEGPTLLFVHVGMWSILWRDLLIELQTDFRLRHPRRAGEWAHDWAQYWKEQDRCR